MPFDPFGDFEQRGYLRNILREKDQGKIKELEHQQFNANVKKELIALQKIDTITYSDVLKTHERLFSDFYPWAGQDRSQTASHISISKGGDPYLFVHPHDCAKAVDYALKMGNDRKIMRETPGRVMGERSCDVA